MAINKFVKYDKPIKHNCKEKINHIIEKILLKDIPRLTEEALKNKFIDIIIRSYEHSWSMLNPSEFMLSHLKKYIKPPCPQILHCSKSCDFIYDTYFPDMPEMIDNFIFLCAIPIPPPNTDCNYLHHLDEKLRDEIAIEYSYPLNKYVQLNIKRQQEEPFISNWIHSELRDKCSICFYYDDCSIDEVINNYARKYCATKSP